MKQKKEKIIIPFVKYHTFLSALFDPSERAIILHLLEIDALRKMGYQCRFSKAEYMKRIGLKEHAFDKAIKRLSDMELLTVKHDKINRVYYALQIKTYNNLIENLSKIKNTGKLRSFCDQYFNVENKSIKNLTDEDIQPFISTTELERTHFTMVNEEDNLPVPHEEVINTEEDLVSQIIDLAKRIDSKRKSPT